MTKFNIPNNIITLAQQRGKQLSNLMHTPPPNSFEIGQIWSTYQSLEFEDQVFNTEEPRLVVILTNNQDNPSILKAAPISIETHYAAQYDLLVTSENNSLGFDFMIEVWNETPVFNKHLKQFLGQLSDNEINILRQIYSLQIFNDPIPDTLQTSVGIPIFGEEDSRLAFQEKEVLSISYLTQAATYWFDIGVSKEMVPETSSWLQDIIFEIKPLFESRESYLKTPSNVAYAETKQDAIHSWFIRERDSVHDIAFDFEIIKSTSNPYPIKLLIHYISENINGNKCEVDLITKKKSYLFSNFILTMDEEITTSGDKDFNPIKIEKAKVTIINE